MTLEKRIAHSVRMCVAATLLSSLACISLAAPMHKDACPAEFEREASAMIGHMRNWFDIHRTYLRYGTCDDGYIAEGYSENVARMLADHWSEMGQLSALISQTPTFEQFVIRHIDSTLDTEDLDRIIRQARTACPAESGQLCQSILAAALSAQREAATE